MFDIPVEFKPQPLEEVFGDYPRLEIDTVTDIQIRLLLATKSIVKLGQEGFPLFVKDIGTAKFNVNDNLSSYINLLSIFKDREIYLAASQDKKKLVENKDLIKYIFD